MQLSTVVGVLCVAFLGGCEKRSDDPFTTFSGVYELYVAPKAETLRKDFLSSRLTLRKNGSFTQTCTYKEKTPFSFEGNWRPLEKNLWFEPFTDCAGVWASNTAAAGKGASLIVEASTLTIFLDPDVNVFYRKIGNGKP